MLHAPDALTPKGRLKAAALWPGIDINVVSANIEEYLAEGYTKSADPDAVLSWTYWRAFDDVHQTRLAMPSSGSLSDESSFGYTQTQIDEIGRLATEALAEFGELVAEDAGTGGYAVITSYR